MSLFKCKMCGGDLEIVEGVSIAECEFCGTRQPVPKAVDENLQNLFNRANALRIKSEFDKAEKIYERIIQVDSTQADAYWGLILCKYGIEYVDDPETYEKIPTCHRASYDSIIADDDYKMAIANADMSQRILYEKQAHEIDKIQKEILALAQEEEPYDVFICYKETDPSGARTHDSVIANDIYHQLVGEGFKVFYAAITLEGKLGSAYEPIIFAALNSAKVMLAIGTKPEYFNAVWVKNEWSRFLKIIKNDHSKVLIPCYRDMDAYELPEEFAHLQAQDMSKIGFINDLIRGIKKVLQKDEPKIVEAAVVQQTVVSSGDSPNTASLLKRAFMFLEDGEWTSANEYCEKILDIDPENAQAYLGKLMAELRVRKKAELKNCETPFDGKSNYQKITRFGSASLIKEVKQYNDDIRARNEEKRKQEEENRKEGIYQKAVALSKQQTSEKQIEAMEEFKRIPGYRDADERAKRCDERAMELAYDMVSELLDGATTSKQFEEIAKLFLQIPGNYPPAKKKAEECRAKAKELAEVERKDAIYDEALELLTAGKDNEDISAIEEAIQEFQSILGWKDSSAQIDRCRAAIADIRDAQERRRIAHEKAVKKAKKVAKIVSLIAIGAAVIILLLIYLIIPMIKFNNGLSLMEKDEYNDAKDIFFELDGFHTSEGKIALIGFLPDLDNENFELAINNILSAEEPVNLKYNLDGGVSANGDSFRFEKAGDFTSLITTQKEGYRFVKWKLNGYSYSKKDSLTVTLDAVWSDGYLITYELNGGSAGNPHDYHKDGESVTLNNPTKEGYTFIGWTGTDLDTPTANLTIPAGSWGDRHYVANWKPTSYTVDYELNGGTNSEENPDTFTVESSDTVLKAPSKDNYIFVGWYADSAFTTEVTNIPAGSIGDMTLYAKWTAVTYTIDYELNGGTNNEDNSNSFTVESDVIVLKAPAKNGYTFLGWYTDGEFTNEITSIPAGTYGNITVYAKWELTVYTITYDLNGGTLAETPKTGFTVEDLPLALPIPTIDFSAFLGWMPVDQEGTLISQITEVGDISLIAQYGMPYLEFTLSSDGTYYIVSKCAATVESVTIPVAYLGKPVKEIGFVAFRDCSSLTSITIPESVTAIGKGAFIGCNSLTSITIPESVTTIGYGAFDGCSSLKSITLPFVGNKAEGTSNTHLGYIFGASLCSYNDDYVPSSLKTVIIMGGSSIGDWAFSDCSSLTSITIPESVTAIGKGAFSSCSSLTKINVDEGNQYYSSVGGVLFNKAQTELIHYPTGKTGRTYTIPDSVTSIGESAFSGCTGLTNVTIPEGVTEIGSWAFNDCSSLTSITIGNGVTSIDLYAFYGCGNLTSIEYTGTIAEWKAISTGSKWKYNVPATKVICSDGEVAI